MKLLAILITALVLTLAFCATRTEASNYPCAPAFTDLDHSGTVNIIDMAIAAQNVPSRDANHDGYVSRYEERAYERGVWFVQLVASYFGQEACRY